MRVFVAPLNDVRPQLETTLAASGYLGWSANGELNPGHALPRVNAHFDLLRWRGGARFRGRRRFLSEVTAELRRRRAGLCGVPIGLLSHPVAHDEEAWAFFAAVLRWTTGRPELTWVGLPVLLRQAGGPGDRRA